MSLLISLLVVLCIIGIFFWAVGQFSLPAPMRAVVALIAAVVAIVVLAHFLPVEYHTLRW